MTAKRIAFRFLFLYLALFCLTLPFSGFEDTRLRWLLCLGSAALAGVLSVLGFPDERLYPWFRPLLRFALAIVMISSGIARVIPVQIPPPGLFDLLQRFGELTPMNELWTLIGLSRAFQAFTGLAGLAGGLLLLLPRTALLGALICSANLLMAVVLSLCYDLPFKLYLFHLFLMSVLLVAPDLRRLVNLFLLDRAVEPAEEEPPPSARAQTLLLLLSLGVIVWSLQDAVRRYGPLYPPKPPLYGIWAVEDLAGEDAEMDQWGWMIFEDPGALDVALRIGTRRRYALDLDMERRTLRLDRRRAFSFSQPEDDVLILDSHPARVTLRRMKLTNPWFHWITHDLYY